jgi:hypothetical protein
MVEKYTRRGSDAFGAVVIEFLVLWYMTPCAVIIGVLDDLPLGKRSF